MPPSVGTPMPSPVISRRIPLISACPGNPSNTTFYIDDTPAVSYRRILSLNMPGGALATSALIGTPTLLMIISCRRTH